MVLENSLAKNKISSLMLAALTSTSIVLLSYGAQAQSAGVIPAQKNQLASSLEAALLDFGKRTNIQLVYPSSITRGKSTRGITANMSNYEALSALLEGTGLTYSFVDSNTVIVRDPNSDNDLSASVSSNDDLGGASVKLDPIVVIGERQGSETSIYGDPSASSYISNETIDHYRGSSPADIFRGTPGVISGESRNGAGSIDVNIRGMQGMGRVAVKVDGASNAVTLYQGYQGVSNRTFVDPDLLAGVDITKGSDMASNGIAGTVSMRTLSADDIVKPGKKAGVKLKVGFGTNSSSPPAPGTSGGYQWPSNLDPRSVISASPYGLDRPDLLKPTQESLSLAMGYKGEALKLVAGYAYRSRGNYHAGTNGDTANPVGSGPVRQYCPAAFPFLCSPLVPPQFRVPLANGTQLMVNDGSANFREGEEVLNTQLETKSFLGKASVRFNDSHSAKLTYTGFRSEAGDRFASQMINNVSQPRQNPNTSRTEVDSFIFDYRWHPESTFFDVKTKLWATHLRARNQRIFQVQALGSPAAYGLPADFRNGSDSLMWGADILNKSALTTQYGNVNVDLGASLLSEETGPDSNSDFLKQYMQANNHSFFFVEPRNGTRKELSGFTKVNWEPKDWLRLNAGLKYQHAWNEDKGSNTPDHSDGGFSQSVGISVTPWEPVQLYGKFSNALRLPSLFESVSVGALTFLNGNLTPERARNWEIGTNFNLGGLISDDDQFMMKLGYFDWTINDYIAREWYQDPSSGLSGMRMFNIDKAHFSGLEFNGRYENNGFTAELAANYYTDVQFCRLANSCENKSLYADYSTNQIPPEYMVNLTLSQKFLDNALTIGGRMTHVGERAISHGDVAGRGAQDFVALIDWKSHTLFDAFAEYEINDNLKLSIKGENLTDQFYIDPLSLVNQPAPGRTIYGSLKASF